MKKLLSRTAGFLFSRRDKSQMLADEKIFANQKRLYLLTDTYLYHHKHYVDVFGDILWNYCYISANWKLLNV